MDVNNAYDIVRTVLEKFGYVPLAMHDERDSRLSQVIPDFYSQMTRDSFTAALISEIQHQGFLVESDLGYFISRNPTVGNLVIYVTDSTGPR